MPSRDTREPLQKRVDDYLRVKNSAYIVEEIEDTETQVILGELREAEKELQKIQDRIARLKALLAESQSD